jgi:putative copper resistance protein D
MIRQELVYSSLVEYTGLEAPERVVQSYDAGRSAELFRVNCVMCHGVSMEGDGPIATLMTVLPVKVAVEERDPNLSRVPVPKKLGPAPANLTLPLTQDSSEGDIFAYITFGGRQGSAAVFRGNETRSPMPPFQWLLSEDDRWALVRYVLDR